MRVYIAGPMTGRPGYNFDAFNAAEKKLNDMGYGDVANPVLQASDYVAGRITEKEMIAEETADLAGSDAIYLLKGWNNSRGARRELAMALMLNMEILLED